MQETLTIILEATPHNYAKRSLTLPNAPAEHPAGRPISISGPAPQGGLRRHKVSRSGLKRRISARERVLLGSHSLQPGLEPAETIWGLLQHSATRYFQTKSKSYQIRHRPTSGTQAVPRLPALARVAPFLPPPLGAS